MRIPDDWTLTDLGTLGTFSRGSGIRKADATSGELPAIRYGEIYTDHQEILRSHCSFISEEVSRTAQAIQCGDILFAGSGETKEEIGKCTAFLGDYEAFAGGDIIIFRPDGPDVRFLAYLLNSAPINQQKAQRAQGDAVVHIYATALTDLKLPLPPIHEQQAIAEALSDADGLVEGLERLIAKKRLIKQGAMQLLLTARRRLPGFSGEWESYKISDLELQGRIKLGRGRVISKVDIECTPGEYPIYSSSALNNGMFGRFGQYDFDEELITWSVDGGGYFFHRPRHKFSVTNVCGYIRIIDTSINYMFLAQMLKMKRSGMNFDYQDKAHPSVIRELYVIDLPNLLEQQTIATVLSDMDAEIDALEGRLAKARAIREGMMQQLLTGQIRLV